MLFQPSVLTFMTAFTLVHSELVIHVQQGDIRGTTLVAARSNRTFFAFMGIPYAKPPIGQLRFKSPEPPEAWNGTRDAIQEGPNCPQRNPYTNVFEGEEDCLYLNIYVPEQPDDVGNRLKAVMFWIHGGGWHFGSGNRADNGPDYFMDEDIVLVTINYRLGALGFLSLPNANVYGNNGLKDQVMALRWIQQNVEHFGGDPGKVTIFGASAGGASVHYHMLSQMSQGLFHRSISQSGSTSNPWAFTTPDINQKFSFSLGELLGHNTTDSVQLIELLRLEPVEKIINTTKALKDAVLGIPFHPTIDLNSNTTDVFLPDAVSNLVKSGKMLKVPYIAGINSREGIWELQAVRKALVENTVHLEDIPGELGIKMDNNRIHEVSEQIRQLYFGNSTISEASLEQHLDLAGDLLVTAGVYFAARKQAQFSTQPVYFYEFSYSGGMSIFKKLVEGDNIEGSCHLDDTAYLFHMERMNDTFNSESSEIQSSKRIVKLWVNFANTGNPTPEPDPLLQNVIWTAVTNEDLSFMSINSNLTMKHYFNKDRMMFWESLQQCNLTTSET